MSRIKKYLSFPRSTKTLLWLAVVVFLFNLNVDSFRAELIFSYEPVVGEGTGGYIAKWGNTIASPTTPTTSGSNSGYVNQSINYTFTSTDPAGSTIRYGVDWKKADGTPYISTDTMDGTADVWLPASGYVSSGTSQNTNLVWTTAGNKKFQVLAQNFQGVNSSWSSAYAVSITEAPVTGVCGTANKNYPAGSTSYGTDTFCSAGTPSPASPPFPTVPSPTTWICLGSGGGADSPNCTATLINATHSVTITSVSTGGSVVSSPSGINCSTAGINCAYTYGEGEVITLTAVPASSYWVFSSWGGASCSGTYPICTFTVDGPETATATFTLRAFNYKEF